jgi:hypothetical protein
MEASEHTYSGNGASEQSPLSAHEAADHLAEHPELPVLGALAGGFILAKIIGAFTGDDD